MRGGGKAADVDRVYCDARILEAAAINSPCRYCQCITRLLPWLIVWYGPRYAADSTWWLDNAVAGLPVFILAAQYWQRRVTIAVIRSACCHGKPGNRRMTALMLCRDGDAGGVCQRLCAGDICCMRQMMCCRTADGLHFTARSMWIDADKRRHHDVDR